MIDELNAQTPIRTDVPIEIHPDSLAGLGKVLNLPDTIGIHIYSAGREALKVIYDSLALLNDAEKELQQTLTPAQRKEAIKAGKDVRVVEGQHMAIVYDSGFIEAAHDAFRKIGPSVDRRLKELDGHRQVFEEKVARALDEPSRKSTEGLALAVEVRAHIKNMPASERNVFIRAAVEAGDKLTIAAILHAQHFLSGLDCLAFDNLRRQAAFKFAPVDAAQHEATGKVIQRVENARSNLFMRYIKIIERREAKFLSAQKNVKTLA